MNQRNDDQDVRLFPPLINTNIGANQEPWLVDAFAGLLSEQFARQGSQELVEVLRADVAKAIKSELPAMTQLITSAIHAKHHQLFTDQLRHFTKLFEDRERSLESRLSSLNLQHSKAIQKLEKLIHDNHDEVTKNFTHLSQNLTGKARPKKEPSRSWLIDGIVGLIIVTVVVLIGALIWRQYFVDKPTTTAARKIDTPRATVPFVQSEPSSSVFSKTAPVEESPGWPPKFLASKLATSARLSNFCPHGMSMKACFEHFGMSTSKQDFDDSLKRLDPDTRKFIESITVQALLNESAAKAADIDGDYGKKTESAVKTQGCPIELRQAVSCLVAKPK